MMKARGKTYIFLFIGLICVTFLIGCTARQEGAGVVNLRFACWGIAEEQAVTRKVVDLFNQTHPHIQVKFEHITWPYLPKILTQYAGGVSPDIFGVDSSMVLDFAQKGTLLNLEPYLKEDKEININDYYSQVVEPFRYEGAFYGLPHEFSTVVLFYNEELFDEAKVAYPNETWRWQDFLSAAQNLTKRDSSGRIEQYGFVCQEVYPIFVYQNGGRVYSEDNKKCIFNSPETVEGLRFYFDLYSKYRVTPNPDDTSLIDAFSAFPLGKAGMYIAGRWTVPELRKRGTIRWNIAHLPKGKERATALVSHAIAISSQSKHPQEAWEFVKFMAGEKAQRENSKMGNLVPSLKKVVESDVFLYDKDHPKEASTNRIYIDALTYVNLAWCWPVNPNVVWAVSSKIQEEEREKVRVGMQTVEEMAKRVEERINDLLRQHHGQL